MLYIGIDLGTSAVKLILMDENGKIHNTVSCKYPIFYPHSGWSEQNPEDWYNQTIKGISELTADADKTRIAGI
ncbi:MAG: xylulokinase, partial [Alphaproteobacteria bacterium]|nr:xylulokinase [Alphaproteobacteria bacterium]